MTQSRLSGFTYRLFLRREVQITLLTRGRRTLNHPRESVRGKYAPAEPGGFVLSADLQVPLFPGLCYSLVNV